jgi:hypothetical protein
MALRMRLKATTLAFLCVWQTTQPASLRGQEEATWSTVLQVTGRVLTAPAPDLAECFSEVRHPDSLLLRAAGRTLRTPIGHLWTTDSTGGRWEPLLSPRWDDSITVKVLGYSCPDGPTSQPAVLVEHSGALARLFSGTFADADRIIQGSLSDTITIALTSTIPNRPVTQLRRLCEDTTCFGGLSSVQVLLDSLKRQRDRIAAAKAQEAARQRARAAKAQAEREAGWRAAGWTEVDIATIRAGQIRVGMNKAMVRAAWGAPATVNTTTTTAGTEEQWVYGLGQYVYFDVDQKVRTIQNTR